MSNVKRVIGGVPPVMPKIRDLEVGESGYTVEWAFNKETMELDTSFTIGDKGGTMSLWVECIAPGEYAIEFETPTYRNPITGNYSKSGLE